MRKILALVKPGAILRRARVRPAANCALAILLLGTPPALAQTRITLGYLPSNAFMAAFVAQDQGFFSKHGLEVDFDLLPSSSLLWQALATGRLQAGTLPVPSLLRAADLGAALQIIAGAALLTHEHPISGIAAGQHSGIKVAADFRGRKVGIPGVNGINHLIFMKWLQDRGVDPRSVKFERVLLPRMAASLRSGKIDAALPIEPFLSEIVQADAGYLISKFPGDREKPFVAAVYAMPRSWVEKNPQAARAFKEALREGAQWISGNEAAARKTQVHYLKISEDSAMTDVLPEFALDVRASDIEFWIDLCHRFKAIKGTVPVASVLAE